MTRAAVHTNLRILIVDDFSSMRCIVKNLLADLGFQNTVESADGRSALVALHESRFDVVVTDWNMPGMSGLELLKAIRDDPELARLPVLMITAEARREQIVEAAHHGINGYIIKPFTAEILRHKLDKVFARMGMAA